MDLETLFYEFICHLEAEKNISHHTSKNYEADIKIIISKHFSKKTPS